MRVESTHIRDVIEDSYFWEQASKKITKLIEAAVSIEFVFEPGGSGGSREGCQDKYKVFKINPKCTYCWIERHLWPRIVSLFREIKNYRIHSRHLAALQFICQFLWRFYY